MEEKKIPFFKKIILSIKDLDKYNLLIGEKFGRSIFYLLVLMLIYSLILSVAITYKANTYIDEACDYAKNNIPNFSITAEGLDIESEEPVILDNSQNFKYKLILDDSNTEVEKYQNEIEDYDGIVVLALQNKLHLISDGVQTDIEYKDITDNLKTEQITKESLLDLVEKNNTMIIGSMYLSVLVGTYIVYTISTIIDALALSLLVIIISKMAKISLKYSQCLTISISALTLPVILNLIYSCFNIINGFYMSYFQIMYTIISYIYIVAVVLIMKSDLIKKKQLIKATIEVNKMEKEQENREKPEDKDEDKEKPNEEKNNQNKKGEKQKDKTLDEVKKRVKGKLKDDKDNPEPEANIEGGKR